MAIATVLVVDDDPKATEMLRRTLIYDGFRVVTAANGVDALTQSRDHHPAVIVLDWNMPVMDGLATVSRLRQSECTPVLMLTGRDDLVDKVRALEAGADDYLVKPFAPEELSARVRGLVRRTQRAAGDRPLTFSDLTIDPRQRVARRGDRAIQLSPREWELLFYFMQHPELVLKREQILLDVWKYDFAGDDGVLDVYVGYLRTKLEADGEPRVIHTIRHVGYVLREA